jgi:hypothetical protein
MFEGGDGAHMRRGAEHDDADEQPLDAVQPLMSDSCRLIGKRRKGVRFAEERREPFQP